MTTVAIVDYGAGNLLSLARALEAVGATPLVTDDPAVVAGADAVALPGVGAAGSAMAALRDRGLLTVLHERRNVGTPILGVCLGMQLMCDWLEEGDCAGLGWLPGRSTPLPAAPGCKIPQMGWNQIAWETVPPACVGLTNGFYAYFVHSYRCEFGDTLTGTTAWTDYSVNLCSLVCSENLWGVQFHPEKSGATGLALLRNFITLTGGER